MNKLIYFLYLLLLSLPGFGQTNIFPPDGNVGIGTLNPSWYGHGGTNRVLEINNSSIDINSQSHLILTTGSTTANSSVGTITWVASNSQFNKGVAFIGCSLAPNSTSVAPSSIMSFFTRNVSDQYWMERMKITETGDVCIGTPNTAGYKLSVNGNIRAKEIKVEVANWPDYVFFPAYTPSSLSELEGYIKQNQHLPEIPSAAEVKEKGLNLGDMNVKLLKKVEELTLYIIELEKRMKKLEEIN